MISGTVDQINPKYAKAQNEAQAIISKLRILAQTPVSGSYIRVEQEATVIAFDHKIVEVEKELSIAKADIPKYEIPEQYRIVEIAKQSEAQNM